MRSSSLTPVITVAVAIGVALTLLTVGFSHTSSDKGIVAATPAAHTSSNEADPDVPAPDPDVIVGSAQDGPGKRVALTFDDGPDPTWTPKILDQLAAHHIKATFCLIGTNAKRYPDLVRRIVAEGHLLCDHTMTHDEKLKYKPAAAMRSEIVGTKQAILDAAPNAQVRYFRAPEGAFSAKGAHPSMQQIAAGNGMQPLAWKADPEDWTKPGVGAIVERVQHQVGDDGVVLLHDAGGDRSQTMTALDRLIPWFASGGYRFVFPA
jgi:peptidoglycan/xylan/chitin deacetylase (PgdA/CDA1 family)